MKFEQQPMISRKIQGARVGPYLGWKAFVSSLHTPILTSPFMGGIFPVGDNKINDPHTDEIHSTLGLTACGCGFWCFNTYKHLCREFAMENVGKIFSNYICIYTLVEGWGEVVEHETGFRSEFLRVKGFALPPDMNINYINAIDSLAKEYEARIYKYDRFSRGVLPQYNTVNRQPLMPLQEVLQ